MPVANLRNVSDADFSKAAQLTDAMSNLINAFPGLNNADVQSSVNNLLLDMSAYAKELLKTEIPQAEQPLI